MESEFDVTIKTLFKNILGVSIESLQGITMLLEMCNSNENYEYHEIVMTLHAVNDIIEGSAEKYSDASPISVVYYIVNDYHIATRRMCQNTGDMYDDNIKRFIDELCYYLQFVVLRHVQVDESRLKNIFEKYFIYISFE